MTTAPRRFADEYVDTVNRGAYDELSALFAEDANFLGPNRQEFSGRAAIGAFYDTFLPTITPKIRIASYVEDGDDCVYELESLDAETGTYRLAAIDHATLDSEGKVSRFTVWTK